MYMLRTVALAALLPFLASAHVQMSEPFPINSAKDPAVPDNLKDYSMNAPLSASGENFPCKGYHLQETSHVSKATYKAGGSGKMSFAAGGAVHGGGSCQISLSYDNGATWKVIKSMIGGCPVTPSYDFSIPADAPSSDDVLLAWTWFNLIGNREMYMNCARVTIEGGAPAGRHRRAEVYRRQGGMSSLPDMFTCNIGKGCSTKENQNVDFPNPGSDVVKGDNSGNTNSGAGFDGAQGGSAGVNEPAPAPAPAPPAPAPAPPAPSAPSAPFPNGTSSADTPAKPAPTGGNVVVPIASAPPTTPPTSGSCTPGSIVCTSTTTWSMCVPGAGGASSPMPMGSVAAGTTCVDGKIA